MKNNPIFSIITVFLQACAFQGDSPPPHPVLPYYTVTISKENIRKVHVDAVMLLREDTLRMSPVGIAPLPDGYGTFVHELTATDANGIPIDLTPSGAGLWKAGASLGTVIQLSYDVSIGHDSVPWSVSSAFARAYALDNVLFFTGRTLFIASKGFDSSAIEVHFALPREWKIATVYSAVEHSPGTFQAKNLPELWDNGNLAGNFSTGEITTGKLRITLAGTHSMEDGFSIVRNMIKKTVNAYAAQLGGAPDGKLVILGTVAPLIQGGETFPKSISLLFNQPPDMSNTDQWATLLAHEILHLWNGEALSAWNQSSVEWFVEGVTDYLSLLTARRTGYLTEAAFLQRLSLHVDTYLRLVGHLSMVKAGADKGSNYGLIYSGGASVAMALDIICHRATKNKEGLFKILEKMYAAFGVTGEHYTYEDIIKVSSGVADTDLSHFFLDHVSGIEALPMAQYLGFEGLVLREQNGQTTIEKDPGAAQNAKDLFDAILYK